MQDNQKCLIDLSKFVILVDNRNQKRLIRPSDHKNFKWRKQPMKLAELSKYEYYQAIQVGNNTLKPFQQDFEQQSEEDQILQGQNNRQIYTLQQAQKLKQQEISQMKGTKKGDQIIEVIANNNEQFEKRTQYSKQKYLAKKKKKYLFYFHVEPTSLQSIHQYYYETQLKSVGGIRFDIFGFMLLQASPFKRVLLAEQTKGLFLSSLLIKQAKNITVYSEDQKNFKRYPIVQQMNIPRQQTQGRVSFRTWQKIKQQKQTFSNLIMAGNFDFTSILEQVLPYLEPNCVICLFSQHIQLLSGALQKMLVNPKIIHTKLFDSWARNYQVLKNRTHPHMYMHSNPGYCLVGYVVQ